MAADRARYNWGVDTAVFSQLAAFQQLHNDTPTVKTLTTQDQISPLDVAFEIDDGRFLAAVSAPDSPDNPGLSIFGDAVPKPTRLRSEGLGRGQGRGYQFTMPIDTLAKLLRDFIQVKASCHHVGGYQGPVLSFIEFLNCPEPVIL